MTTRADLEQRILAAIADGDSYTDIAKRERVTPGVVSGIAFRDRKRRGVAGMSREQISRRGGYASGRGRAKPPAESVSAPVNAARIGCFKRDPSVLAPKRVVRVAKEDPSALAAEAILRNAKDQERRNKAMLATLERAGSLGALR